MFPGPDNNIREEAAVCVSVKVYVDEEKTKASV
jgi:hypothetical protein